MSRFRIALAVAVAAAVVAVPAAAAPAQGTLTLAVNSDAFVISLTAGGSKVRSVKAGSYTIRLVDKSAIHDVRLLKGSSTVKGRNASGKNVDVKTTVPQKKTLPLTVTLSRGTYTFVCDPHVEAGMKGTFRVT